MSKYKYRIKAVCASIAKIYSLLNALQFKVLFHATYELCMYIYTYIKKVCIFLMWTRSFLGGIKIRGEGCLKCNLQAICNYKFHSRDFQVFGAHLHTGRISQEMNLNGCSKINQRLYLCISTFSEFLLH